MQDVYKKYECDVFGQKDSQDKIQSAIPLPAPVVVIDADKVKKPDPTSFDKQVSNLLILFRILTRFLCIRSMRVKCSVRKILKTRSKVPSLLQHPRA